MSRDDGADGMSLERLKGTTRFMLSARPCIDYTVSFDLSGASSKRDTYA